MTAVVSEPTLDPNSFAVGTSTPRMKMPTKADLKPFDKPLGQPNALVDCPFYFSLLPLLKPLLAHGLSVLDSKV